MNVPSALDVSIQKQVIGLLLSLQKKLNLIMIFITHDLRVASQISHKTLVLQKGKMIEYKVGNLIFTKPEQEYTKQLLEASPAKNWSPVRYSE